MLPQLLPRLDSRHDVVLIKNTFPPKRASTMSKPVKTQQNPVQSVQNQIDKNLDDFAKILEETQQNSSAPVQTNPVDADVLFRRCLMDNIAEGVIFVDRNKVITQWNKGAELITGLSTSNTVGVQFTPELIGLSDEKSADPTDCPVTKCLSSVSSTNNEYSLVGRSGRESKVRLLVAPVGDQRGCIGCVILIQDMTANADLKRQLSLLKNASSLDPLTHVANRGAFEQNLNEYVTAHKLTNATCCLIICDLDFFKKVNDTYGHHVGDQALVAFAQKLQQFVRARDIVARYGGEEFVILCANCDLENAIERAEQIRMSLNRTPQQMLDGKTLSASFGVAELRNDEDATELFVRADKALFAAKKGGRNRVEYSSEPSIEEDLSSTGFETSSTSGLPWRKWKAKPLFCQEYKTSTPLGLLTEKLRGYILETNAIPVHLEQTYVSLLATGVAPGNESKKTEFRVDIEMCEPEDNNSKTRISHLRITIFEPKQRMFRRAYPELHARVMIDLRRFLMLSDEHSDQLERAATSSGRDGNE